jgi:tmRNA-binding protein
MFVFSRMWIPPDDTWKQSTNGLSHWERPIESQPVDLSCPCEWISHDYNYSLNSMGHTIGHSCDIYGAEEWKLHVDCQYVCQRWCRGATRSYPSFEAIRSCRSTINPTKISSKAKRLVDLLVVKDTTRRKTNDRFFYGFLFYPMCNSEMIDVIRRSVWISRVNKRPRRERKKLFFVLRHCDNFLVAVQLKEIRQNSSQAAWWCDDLKKRKILINEDHFHRLWNKDLEVERAALLCFHLFFTSCAGVSHEEGKSHENWPACRTQKKRKKKRETFDVILNIRWNLSSVHWVRN